MAAELLEQFHDGVWFVEFATIEDGALVIENVAGALDLRQEAERSLLTTLTSFLRNKQLLLILDNCEHVVAACARLAETLLRSCPQLRILASSREPLSIAGETAWPLPPLSLPNHWRDLGDGPDAFQRLSEYEAVRLFIDRATLARPAFQPTNENIVTIAQICWRLDGIALAIELAAARIRVLTLQQIVERLDDRFHLLTTGSRTAVPRQQTLRSLIDWSHDLLSEPERVLFRRLSVFARGRTLESIEAVCSDATLETWGIVDLLTQLVDKSLVFVEKGLVSGARYTCSSPFGTTRMKTRDRRRSGHVPRAASRLLHGLRGKGLPAFARAAAEGMDRARRAGGHEPALRHRDERGNARRGIERPAPDDRDAALTWK
ncbi:MAG: hypothetical protein WDN28_07865 [Chthoniobacter sp.]